MPQAYQTARDICKTIRRNGYDAYMPNAYIQKILMEKADDTTALDCEIFTDIPFKGLDKLFPEIKASQEPGAVGKVLQDEVTYRFYHTDGDSASHPEESVVFFTPRMLKKLESMEILTTGMTWSRASEIAAGAAGGKPTDDFMDTENGEVRFYGVPEETLRQDYLRGVQALRVAVNFHLPIEANTWIAIIRGTPRILDYVSVSDIMDEWRKVEAENMHVFVQLLFDTQLLHSLIPAVAALSRLPAVLSDGELDEKQDTIFNTTLRTMQAYSEAMPYDWLGTMGCLFHRVGTLYTAEFSNNRWTFQQHHRVGARITRKFLNRLRCNPEEVDLICHLVEHHRRFSLMLTSTGIRRFRALKEHTRLIEIARAIVKAHDGNYTEFNHNMKMLERMQSPEGLMEPLLNGNEIMEFTGLAPGPIIGNIREALLQAQLGGEVSSVPDAVEFCLRYKDDLSA